MQTTIVLIRHGQTDWNKTHRVQGQTDIPLSDEGKEQARLLGEKLTTMPLDFLYSSTLSRAKETAEIIAKITKHAVIANPAFNERNYGVYEGKFWADVDAEYAKKGVNFHHTTPPNGESLHDFVTRITTAFDATVAKHVGKTIALVCHGGVLHVLIRHLRGVLHTDSEVIRFPNTSMSVFHLEGKNIVEKLVADASHLDTSL